MAAKSNRPRPTTLTVSPRVIPSSRRQETAVPHSAPQFPWATSPALTSTTLMSPEHRVYPTMQPELSSHARLQHHSRAPAAYPLITVPAFSDGQSHQTA